MNLESITLSEGARHEKPYTASLPLHVGSRTGKPRDRKWMSVCQGLGGGDGEDGMMKYSVTSVTLVALIISI